MPIMRVLGVGLLLLLTACAAAPTADPNVRACEALPVGDCLALLNGKNLQAKSIDGVLMRVAESHLARDKPKPAIEYLEALQGRDDDSAPTYRKLGDAFSMLAGQKEAKTESVYRVLAKANYLIASLNYMLASARNPSDQANYSDGTRMAIEAGSCELARSILADHLKHFGTNDRQQELATLVKERCG
jgi:hypothetical protein